MTERIRHQRQILLNMCMQIIRMLYLEINLNFKLLNRNEISQTICV
jgi:hypothetical protein